MDAQFYLLHPADPQLVISRAQFMVEFP